eukprot:Pompholyxophrys_punicea_v1_NODE_480_length_1864_cov_10.111664.p1 type:complete len:385 gc:universal NODE_480_length_1864_cov_10.111664:1756-602(-)
MKENESLPTKVLNMYSDPEKGLTSVQTLQKRLQSDGIYVSQTDIKNILKNSEAYSLQRPQQKNFERRRVFVSKKDDQWAADLADMSNIAKYNDDVKFLLIVIDIFTKFAWVRTLKNKEPATVKKAFLEIMESSGRKPKKFWADDGSEFKGSFANLLKDYNIERIIARGQHKASVAERFNRTLKEKMYKYFNANRTWRYVDVLQSLLNNYNNTIHSSIKMTPTEASQTKAEIVYKNLYENIPTGKKPKFQVGDFVRIPIKRKTFQKGYEGLWSVQVYLIKSIESIDPPSYKIETISGHVEPRIYYEPELLPAQEPNNRRVEKILQTRGNDADKEYLVKWVGYSDKDASWIKASDLNSLTDKRFTEKKDKLVQQNIESLFKKNTTK